ncbi:hypothetical protein QBC46DRAFT_337359 [Diplogelasinospora grovesii]|uniref:AMP-activated protein kinase glycogen-binding domain-containing protein n=1 Tax=Diplogelasinospora grovesii TaxID=303347 RepID=A0AAN6S870_9PEZI|nr:hypothetical protein QBC46DRAFT_337359 [Diplogelasinospora grovesii]
MAASADLITITYQKPGTQPPIFVAGTFSDPEWEPQEMDYTTDAQGEHVFKKEVLAEPGSKIQYKFRVGTGDWWVLNENTPSVMDSSGFRNNELEVPASKESSTGASMNGNAVKDAPQTAESKEDADNDVAAQETAEEGAGSVDIAPEAGDKATANAAKELFGPSDHRAGDSTPDFARTADEVADSAALLDQEEPEPRIPDDEAGRIGYRRMSATPMPDVANTAAEVADTAKNLDNDEAPVELDTRPNVVESLEVFGHDEQLDDRDDHGDHKPPLFSHECIGMYNPEEVHEGDEYEENHEQEVVADEFGPDDIDVNDPTLERFPSNREEIIDTVRKLETGLNEDRASFEGVPPSPIVTRGGPTDMIGDYYSASPIVASPVISRSSNRLQVAPRSPRGSVSSNQSLHSISEAEEEHGAAEEDQSPAGVTLLSPPMPPKKANLKLATTHDDEGVVISDGLTTDSHKPEDPGLLTPEAAVSPRTVVTPKGGPSTALDYLSAYQLSGAEATERPVSDGVSPKTTSAPVARERDLPESPRIVIETAEAADVAGSSPAPHAEGSTLEAAQTAGGHDADAINGARTRALDTSNSNQLRKRHEPGDRAATPTSVRSTGTKANEQGNWFRAFFRLIFVDWIGGFVSKLCGGGRKT